MLPFLAISAVIGGAGAISLSVASSGGNASSPLAYGLMFEDINHSGDGGIYAELIQNRAFQGGFEYPASLDPWVPLGDATLTLVVNSTTPLGALSNSVSVTSTGTDTVGILNPGWWGISVLPQTYTGSFWVFGTYEGNFTASFKSNLTNDVWASQTIVSEAQAGVWVEHNVVLTPTLAAPNSNNTFTIEFEGGQGPLSFTLISLFPPTYNNRPNGQRIDLMEALKELNPSFLRMPGGNNIEGDNISHQRWAWNETIGSLTSRPGRAGTWGYQNTDGLGLVEYLNWCTDLDVEPILAIWAGLYLNGYVDPPDIVLQPDLAPYVEDVMNELEFITGPVTSPFGALRSSLGYPEPWTINFVEIGNEDNLADQEASYLAYRYSMFADAILAKYPNITVISSTGDHKAQSNGSATDFHEYTRPDSFVLQFDTWDNNVAADHKTLIGEYAVIQPNDGILTDGANFDIPRMPWPLWVGSVAEAVFSLGAERNSYGIIGMSYAPGFQNLNSYQWAPDLISFSADPAQNVLSTSYQVIKLLSNARYSETVPVTITSNDTFGPNYWVAGTSGPGDFTFKVAVYNATETQSFSILFDGVEAGSSATLTVLSATDGLASNELTPDGTVTEVITKSISTVIAGSDGSLSFDLENYSVAVLTT